MRDEGCVISMVVLATLGLMIVAGVWNSWSKSPDDACVDVAPSGEITSPNLDEKLWPKAFVVRGTLSGIPPGMSVWITITDGKLQWPKEEVLERADFTVKLGEYGTLRTAHIRLLMVSADLSEKFHAWRQTGHRSGSFPGWPMDFEAAEATTLAETSVSFER